MKLVFLLGFLVASVAHAQTGNPRVTTRAQGDNSNFTASTAYVDRALSGKAPNVNPQFSGTVKADTLQILGPGSTGDVSTMDVVTDGLSLSRKLSSKLADLPLTPNDFAGLAVGQDFTAAVQAAFDTGLAQNRPVRCNGTYRVSKVIVKSSGLRLQGACDLVGNATVPTSAVLEVQAGVLRIEGSLGVSGNYNTNYEAAILWTTSTQGSFISNLSASAAKLCYNVGSADKPAALMSEVTIVGGNTYGCTQVAKFTSLMAVVHIIGAQWSSDAFGAPSQNWASVPFRGITSLGSDINMIGGELIMTNVTTGYLIENQPLTGLPHGTFYGRLRFVGTTMETASPLARAINPSNLTIAPNAQQRGTMSFIGVSGYISQDQAPFIYAAADYDGDIVWEKSQVTFPSGIRTQPNIQADGLKADIYVDDMGFGPGLRPSLAGTVGGVVHFGTRQVLSVSSIAGQNISTGVTDLVFKGAENSGDFPRFQNLYNQTTGEFTVPAGGLKDVIIDVRLASTSFTVNGFMGIFVNGTEVAEGAVSRGRGSLRYAVPFIPGGVKLKTATIGFESETTGDSRGSFNTMTITARN